MLFNSYIFIFAFLPFVLLLYYGLNRYGKHETALVALFFCSMFFYGWWDVRYIPVILVSVMINYCFANLLHPEDDGGQKPKWILTLAVVVNLSMLGYFKYINFFADVVNQITGTEYGFGDIILPLGISFFTFQQVMYLVDTWRGHCKKYGVLHYLSFVTFFPHLVAGPLLHHSKVMSQFIEKKAFNPLLFITGLTLFFIGLAKKGFIADSLAGYANTAFASASAREAMNYADAWIGSLSYTFQLYFDFSGYSDMAIGLALMFGIRFPVNFNSPYKALSITDFWRRWHISLSNFLRDYLYIPLGGNRKGEFRRNLNLIVTMFLGGLWHGAGFTYIVWGILHGVYLVIHRLWTLTGISMGKNFISRYFAMGLTFFVVMIAWIFFRADSLGTAFYVIEQMAMIDFTMPTIFIGESLRAAFLWIVVAALVAFFLPNSQQMCLNDEEGVLDAKTFVGKLFKWRFNVYMAFVMAVITVLGVVSISRPSEFLYFQF